MVPPRPLIPCGRKICNDVDNLLISMEWKRHPIVHLPFLLKQASRSFCILLAHPNEKNFKRLQLFNITRENKTAFVFFKPTFHPSFIQIKKRIHPSHLIDSSLTQTHIQQHPLLSIEQSFPTRILKKVSLPKTKTSTLFLGNFTILPPPLQTQFFVTISI